MTPLPFALGSGKVVFWRIDQAKHRSTWDSGEGSYLAGGRWNPKGVRAVYASLDPATAILEVAVHKTFRTLDTVAHVLTSAEILDVADIHVLTSGDVPNPNWLNPGTVGLGQMAFGEDLLKAHPFTILPSVVSSHSWNVIFDPTRTGGRYRMLAQETFALDPRLHRP